MSLYAIDLHFPMGGLWERTTYQSQPPYTTSDCLNVRPDCTVLGRERGGSRPGLGKAFAAELGSGNPIRSIADVSFISGDTWVTRMLAVANGTLYMENGSGAMASVGSGLSTSKNIQSCTYLQKQYFANYSDASITGNSDGALSGSTLTSATNFTSAGVDSSHVAVFEGSQTAQSEVLTVTIAGTASAGTFTLRLTNKRKEITTDSGNTQFYEDITVDFDETTASLQTKLRAMQSIGGSNVTVSGSTGGPWTITFASSLANKDMVAYYGVPKYFTIPDHDLTGVTSKPPVRIKRLKHGATRFPLQTVAITSVSGTTATLADYDGPEATAGLKFRIEPAPKVYDPVTTTLSKWSTDSAIKGVVPAGCPIICTWGERIVLAGPKYAPHAYFMCRKGDPNDWDYSQEDAGAAVAGVSGLGGQPADPITAAIPHNDDCLILGCTTSLWVMRGDPALGGGTLDRLSNRIGIIDKTAWCHAMDPKGGAEALVFLSNDGLYAMAAECGSSPESLSRFPLPEELLAIDRSTTTVSLAYDVRYRGIQIWLTKNDSSAATHWWFDWEQKSFWPVTHETAHEATALMSRRDKASDYSLVMIGCRDGYIRRYQHNLAQDDSIAFTSRIKIGPLKMGKGQLRDGILREFHSAMAVGSGDVDVAIKPGKTAEAAANASARYEFTLTGDGLQATKYPAERGGALCIEFSNGEENDGWVFPELLTVVIEDAGWNRI